jgi:hypothetical protein
MIFYIEKKEVILSNMKLIKLKSSDDKNIKTLSIKNKCKCGTKVLLDDAFDIIYYGKYDYLGFLEWEMILMFGYICPGCGSRVDLNKSKSIEINKYLSKQGFDARDYYDKYWDLEFSISVNITKNGIVFNKDEFEQTFFDECIEKGYPIPIQLYNKYIKEDDE